MPQAMPTTDDIYQAIRNADAAGDSASVQKLGAYLANMNGAANAKAQADTAAWQQTINPANGGGSLQIGTPFGNIDTHIPTPQWLERGLAGVGKAGTDLVRGAGQWVGAVDRNDVAQSRAQDAPLMATTAGKVGNIVGNVAIAAPTALIPGANTITGGALIGATLGALQPSTSTGETLTNVGLGAAGGAAVPAVARGYQVAKAAAEPFYAAGQQAIVGRALNRAAGSDAPVVAQRLADASAPFVGPSQGVPRTTMGELVPGSIPTVGQASGNAGVASLERAATAVNPDVTNALDKTIKAQQAARVAELTDLAGTDGARDFHNAARQATAQDLYERAFSVPVEPDTLSASQRGEITKLMNMPAIQDALKQARTNAANYGMSLERTDGSIAGLHQAKLAMDDQISKLMGGSAAEVNKARAVTAARDRLVTFMESMSPDYNDARTTYQAMSRPINQMDIAQEIANKSVNKLTQNVMPNSYANALTDATAQRVTGMPGATLENTLSPNQNNRLQMLLEDVRRSAGAEAAGKGTGSDTVRKLAYSNLMDQSGVPTFIRDLAPAQIVGNIGSRFADAAYGRANAELSNRLAQVMLDPAEASRLMFAGTPKSQAANQLLLKLSKSAQAAALSAPSLANRPQ